MTTPRLASRTVVCLVLSLALAPAVSQPVSDVQGADLVALVSGRTLAISFYGDPTKPLMTFVWDFRKDGSLCARAAGVKRSDPCEDLGKWTATGGTLCWELPTLGKLHGIDTACSSIRRDGAELYELRNRKSPELSFGKFLQLAP